MRGLNRTGSSKLSHIEALKERIMLTKHHQDADDERGDSLNKNLVSSTGLFKSDCEIIASYVCEDIQRKDPIMSPIR